MWTNRSRKKGELVLLLPHRPFLFNRDDAIRETLLCTPTLFERFVFVIRFAYTSGNHSCTLCTRVVGLKTPSIDSTESL